MSRKNKRTPVTSAASDLPDVGAKLAELGSALSEQAKVTGTKAAVLAQEGVDWAAPRVQKALADAREAAGPAIEQARTKAGAGYEVARDKVKDDYLPRVQKAMGEAAEAAKKDQPLGERAKNVTEAAKTSLKEKPKKAKKKSGAGKAMGWVLVGTAVAGAGYLVWRRTQPVDDPWAEEYWDDAAVSQPSAPSVVDQAKDKAADLAEKAKETAADVAGTVKEKAAEVTDKAKDKAEDVTDEAARQVSDATDAPDDAAAPGVPVEAAGTPVDEQRGKKN